MADTNKPMSSLLEYAPKAAGCLRKDAGRIMAAAILLGLLGGALGYKTNTTHSTAQLALTPIPLRSYEGQTQEREPDELARMLATPLDVTSISLLCLSDEVVRETMDRLNESGELSKPIKPHRIKTFKSSLMYEVSIAKETPYDLSYTPIIELTADAKKPPDAKAMVNAWAEAVEAKAKEFQDKIQQPAGEALRERLEGLDKELDDAEEASIKFWTDNNVLYLKERLNEIVNLITKLKSDRTEVRAELVHEQATVDSYLAEDEKPIITLNWTPSPELAALAGAKLGVGVPGSGITGKSTGAAGSVLSTEHINNVYYEIRGKIAAGRAGVSGKEAQLEEIDSLIEALEEEREEVQAQFAKTDAESKRVTRRLEIVEEAYRNIALKYEFAQVAEKLGHPQLQIIARGTEWPKGRFRWPALVITLTGAFGFLAAAFASLAYGLVLKPLLEQ